MANDWQSLLDKTLGETDTFNFCGDICLMKMGPKGQELSTLSNVLTNC